MNLAIGVLGYDVYIQTISVCLSSRFITQGSFVELWRMTSERWPKISCKLNVFGDSYLEIVVQHFWFFFFKFLFVIKC